MTGPAHIDPAPSTGVAIADIREVATRKVSTGKTVGLVAGVALLAAVIAVGVALQNMCILSCSSATLR